MGVRTNYTAVRASNSAAPQLNLYELTLTPEFGALKRKQATFVMFYVQSFLDTGRFDRMSATKFGYEVNSEESARTLSYHLAKHPKVRKVLKRFLDSRIAA